MIEQYGTYAPKKSTFPLQLCRMLGFGRGILKKKLLKAWHSMGYSIVDTKIRGINYRLNIVKNTTDGKLLVASKKYDSVELSYIKESFNKDSKSTFIDIGANTGYYSLNLAREGFANILSIEANPDVINILKQNVDCNGFNNQIKVVPYCVGETGEMEFYTSSGWGSSSVIKQNHKSGRVISVVSKPLIEILKEFNIQQIDALKIDVEGYEDEVLVPFFNETKQNLHPHLIVLEHCNYSDWSMDLLNFLEELSYDVVRKTRANTILKKVK